MSGIYYLVILTSLMFQDVSSAKIDDKSLRKVKCVLPPPPAHGHWTLPNTEESPYHAPGYSVPEASVLQITCDAGYQLEGPGFIICNNDGWSAKIANCTRMCLPLSSTATILVSCMVDGEEVENCREAPSGTVAKFKCADFYQSGKIEEAVCENGKWSNSAPKCEPMCGLKSDDHHPWQAAVYSGQRFLCSATLISERIVVTAATCVTDNLSHRVKPLGEFVVGVGKFHKKYDDEHDSHSQFSKLSKIFVPRSFKGEKNHFLGNIALLVAEKPFTLSHRVLPVCVDWDLKYENSFTSGFLSGWSRSAEDVEKIPAPYVTYDVCLGHIPKEYQPFFTMDKICTGSHKNETSCKNFAGGGLTLKNGENVHYLMGVESHIPNNETLICESSRHNLHTKISSYFVSIFKKIHAFRPSVPMEVTPVLLTAADPPTAISQSQQLRCGFKASDTETLIINGTAAEKGAHPWQIAIYKDERLVCSGSLIHPRVILTAAHCVVDAQTNQIVPMPRFILAAATHHRKFNDYRDKDDVQLIPVEEIFVPEEYQGISNYFIADIAIIIAAREFVLTKYVQTICMDWDGQFENQLLNNKSLTGIVAGWGLTAQGYGSVVLQELKIPYIDRFECKKQLPPSYDTLLTFDKLCSGYLNKSVSVCKGDSGGGLVFRIPEVGRYFLAGIVSTSPSPVAIVAGCDSQQYTLFTRVYHYITSFILPKARPYLNSRS